MKRYNERLKRHARELRGSMTDAEEALWYCLRRKQIHGVQFYRQKPLFEFIVDFYCAKAQLVIELDGSQHREPELLKKDRLRDVRLISEGLQVLRFDNRQVLLEMERVLTIIGEVVASRLE